MKSPLVTIAVPSYNQGKFLDAALESIFAQGVPVEVFVMDGGSTDGTLEVIKKWEPFLAGWRSRPDEGQSAAINEGIALGSAPYVAWLNSDDYYLPGGLKALLAALEEAPAAPVAYGQAFHEKAENNVRKPVWVEAFSMRALAIRCIVCQPATLMRRSAWDAVDGADTSLHMVMDYDLWWRLYLYGGEFKFVNISVAVNRDHQDTKTNLNRSLHYSEAMKVISKYYGRVPIKWYIYQPYAIWWKTLRNLSRRSFAYFGRFTR